MLALLQSYQGTQGSPTMNGPLMPQQLQPGFRAPPQMQMQAPRPQQGFDLSQGMGMLGAGLGALQRGTPAGQEPNRTAGDADLGGYGGQPENPFGNPNAVPTVFNPGGQQSSLFGWLRGLF